MKRVKLKDFTQGAYYLAIDRSGDDGVGLLYLSSVSAEPFIYIWDNWWPDGEIYDRVEFTYAQELVYAKEWTYYLVPELQARALVSLWKSNSEKA